MRPTVGCRVCRNLKPSKRSMHETSPTVVGTARNDTLNGDLPGQSKRDVIYGDPYIDDASPLLTGHGGNDTAFGGEAFDMLFGDAYVLGGTALGGRDELHGQEGRDILYGDAYRIEGGAGGGNDLLFGEQGFDTIYGDGHSMADRASGGNDRILGAEGRDIAFGDACEMAGWARGGNDVLDGGVGPDFLFGDAATMGDDARGGNDSLYAHGAKDVLVGDGGTITGRAVGGNDYLDGGSGDESDHGDGEDGHDGGGEDGDHEDGHEDDCGLGELEEPEREFLFGDAREMSGHVRGGDDRIFGLDGAEEEGLGEAIYGDAGTLRGYSRGGNDWIEGRGGNDDLWGDGVLSDAAVGGTDGFAFRPGCGLDTIHDFEVGKDKIVLIGFGAVPQIVADNGDTILDLDGTAADIDAVRLIGIAPGALGGADILLG
jgi:Ca2+-binding RTX toxin-like protein